MKREQVKILLTDNTRGHGIAGCSGYIERVFDDGAISVLVHDPMDGGLCGPYRLTGDDVETNEQPQAD